MYRHVPVYSVLRFRTVRVRLIFKSPFRWLNWLMKEFQWLVNRREGYQLFYEYRLLCLVPC